jgi:Family of unknown function (DUF6286)
VNDIASRQGDTQVLPPAAGPPRPARAEAWSHRGPRRKARRVFRPRRSIPGVLVAAVLAAAGILGAIQAASAALGRPVWKVPHRDFAGPLQDTHWNDTGTLAVAAAVAFIGLVLVLAGLIPGRPRAIPLASGDESVVIGAPRRSLRRSLARLAADIDGVDSARAKARRRSIVVRASTRLRDTAGLREAVHTAVQDRLAALDPLRPPRVKVRLRRKAG